ncbi:hypothetical protein JCM4814A_80350 [Streptomyces phaeofaciens JCM 4814]|uniref:Uncharacterized protein n=1 Tax=Streptomyces phaeofaciens TaxID=68254 RepID=A0A918M1B0_9ACTN|nr:hypothetical protein GCM10010226_81830 [Streptomyces phaeofaciens]
MTDASRTEALGSAQGDIGRRRPHMHTRSTRLRTILSRLRRLAAHRPEGAAQLVCAHPTAHICAVREWSARPRPRPRQLAAVLPDRDRWSGLVAAGPVGASG